jgi:hypothetical protein
VEALLEPHFSLGAEATLPKLSRPKYLLLHTLEIQAKAQIHIPAIAVPMLLRYATKIPGITDRQPALKYIT